MSSLEIEKLGQYRLLEVIGNGGMARVYRATQEGDHGFSKPVALKLLKPQLAADPESVDAFISEARLGSLLSHPNIVAVLNFGQLEQFYFLAMELMEGPTLFEVLTCHQRLQRRIPPTIIFQLIRQVCEGLGYAHQAVDRAGQPLHVIHRDLKPSNVLLSWHGVAKLGDFGVARAESNLLHTRVGGLAKGTAQYMAPEQAWGELELTLRTDLFALGLMLLHLLNLQHPYQARSPEAMLRKAQEAQLQESIEALPEMSGRARVQELLHQLLQADPARRFDSAETLALALEEIQSLQPVVRLVPWLQELRQAGLNPSALVGLGSASENVSGKGGRNSSGKSFASTPEPAPLTHTTPARPVVASVQSGSPTASAQVPSTVSTVCQTEEELPSQTLAIPLTKEKSQQLQPTRDVPTPPPAESTMVITKGRRAAEITPAEAQRRKSAQESARTELLSGAEVAERLRFARAELEEATGVQEVPSRTLEVQARSTQQLSVPPEEVSLSMPLVEWPDESSQGLSTKPPAAQKQPIVMPPTRNLAPPASRPEPRPLPPTQAPPTAGMPASSKPSGPVFGGAAAQPLKPIPEPGKAPPGVPTGSGPTPPRVPASAAPGSAQTSRSQAPVGPPAGAPSKSSSPAVLLASPSASQSSLDQTSESDKRKRVVVIALVLGLLLVAMVVLAPMLFPSTTNPPSGLASHVPNPAGLLPTLTPAPSGTPVPAAQAPTPGETLYPSIAHPVTAPPGTNGTPRQLKSTDKPQDTAPSPDPKTTPAPVIEAPPPVSQGEGFGYLTLNTVPPDHKVSVDEDDVRAVPVSRLKLPAGSPHQIRFYCHETLAKQVSITLSVDERRTMVWDCEHNVLQRER